MAKPKKQKTDYEALNSPFMRIPQMRVDVARALLDIGLSHIHDLQGRAPETLWADAARRQPETTVDFLPYFKMAVYFAENAPDAEVSRLHPSAWQ